jgi:hypothetical protein
VRKEFELKILFLGAAMMIAASLFFVPPQIQSRQFLIAPPPKLEYFSFGYQMTIADHLWIRAVQDFDYCENQISKNQCQSHNWLAEMLDTITNLAPDYRIVYSAGGLALTVVISDYEGASHIFDKGVKIFPYDLTLLYRAAYHAMVEEKNQEKAAGLLVRAAKAGGSSWFYSLATRLYTEAGKKELALGLYKELEGSDVEPGTLQRIRGKLGISEPTEGRKEPAEAK